MTVPPGGYNSFTIRRLVFPSPPVVWPVGQEGKTERLMVPMNELPPGPGHILKGLWPGVRNIHKGGPEAKFTRQQAQGSAPHTVGPPDSRHGRRSLRKATMGLRP